MTPSFETGDPGSGRELSESLGALNASGAAYLSTLSDQSFFAPQGSAWSPAVHVRHLDQSTSPVGLALKLPQWMIRLRFGKPSAPSRDFVSMREAYRNVLAAGAKAGRYTPEPEPIPADPADRRREIVRGWTTAVVSVQNALTGWSETALDRHRLPHPLMGPLTVREMLSFTVYHTAHHLRRIAERAGG